MSSLETRMDILYGHMNALEIVAEELFAELVRNTSDVEGVLKRISSRANNQSARFRARNDLNATISMQTEDGVKRLLQNLSLALAGRSDPRPRGT